MGLPELSLRMEAKMQSSKARALQTDSRREGTHRGGKAGMGTELGGRG